MKVLICGGRDYKNYIRVCDVMYQKFKDNYPTCIIHGNAPGADSMAEMWARDMEIKLEVYPADWKKYGKAAGPIRNQQMLDEGKPDLVIAFPGGTGTADMVSRAKKAGVEVIQIK